MKLDILIEGILFFKGEPVEAKKIARFCDTGTNEINDALNILEDRLKTGGLRLMRKGDEVMLATAPEMGELIAKVAKEELTRDLSKAALEVLSIVLYRGPVSKREIDYIRGVNSSFILRNLLVRGLIERAEGKENERSFIYGATFDLLSHIGITKLPELPEYEKTVKEINLSVKDMDKEN